MFFRDLLLLLLCVGFIISAVPRQSSADSASKLSETPNIVKALFPSNASIPLPDTSAENVFTIRCDGETYGYNPNIRDCEGAKEQLVPDTTIWTLAERRPDLPADTVPLPYRVMGNRGLCYVEPVLIGDHTSAKASLNMIRQAAAALVLQCAVGDTSQGGVATNIGGDNNLAVTLGTYQNPASCHKPLPSYESCRHLLYSMQADKIPQVFGPRSDPAVTEDLPLSILSPDSRCSVNVFNAGKSDVASYYDIWQAVITVFSACVRVGKTGSIRGLGELGNIFLTMTANPGLELPSNSSLVVSS